MLPHPSSSYVLLPESRLPAADDFRLAWQEVSNGGVAPTEKRWDRDSAELQLEGVTTIVMLMPVPVPNQEAEAAASRSLSSMRAGGFSPAPHVAHLLVASGSPTESACERLLSHTRVVAAIAKASHAIGVYEGNARATHDPAFYVDVVSRAAGLPLVLWNGVSIVRTSDSIEIITLGMSQLELPDLLLVAPPDRGNDALAFVFDLLAYVVSRGNPVPEGESVGRTPTEQLPVRYVPSPIEPATRVMRVELPRRKKR